MIKTVTIINHMGDSIELELMRPEKSGFIVKSIDGLGPGKATINKTEVASNDGAIYNSSRLPSRNIVINLGFYCTHNLSIEDVRHKSYRYFPLKKKVKMIFDTDNRVSEIEGVVESNEPNIFSDAEGCSISIICADPYFYAMGDDGVTITRYSAVKPSFMFPFSNNSLEERMISFGELSVDTEQVVYYDGDVETGVVITIHATGEASDIIISNKNTGERMSVNTSRLPDGKIKTGDVIRITTIKGKKSVVLERAGKSINALNALNKNTDWIKITKGSNIFDIIIGQGRGNLDFTIESRRVYEGV